LEHGNIVSNHASILNQHYLTVVVFAVVTDFKHFQVSQTSLFLAFVQVNSNQFFWQVFC